MVESWARPSVTCCPLVMLTGVPVSEPPTTTSREGMDGPPRRSARPPGGPGPKPGDGARVAPGAATGRVVAAAALAALACWRLLGRDPDRSERMTPTAENTKSHSSTRKASRITVRVSWDIVVGPVIGPVGLTLLPEDD